MKIGDVLSGMADQSKLGVGETKPEGGNGPSFGQILTGLVNDVNTMQVEAGDTVKRFVAGEATDLHEVMIATEKAKTSLDLLMEIRNKAIDAYRELMRTTV